MPAESQPSLRTPAAVLAALDKFNLSAEERAYAATHARRFVRGLAAVERCLQARPAAQRILDIAPHLLTELLASRNAVAVNTVGAPWAARGPRPHGTEHLSFDLNQAHCQTEWPGFQQHDVVVMGEILEHLHASPRMVLGCVRRWIAPGGFLVLQTPNAARLWARLTLLRGINPYELPRDGNDPGHFHEFTLQEIKDLAAFHALDIVSVTCEDDFTPQDVPRWRLALRRLAARPRTLWRESFTIVLRKPLNAVDPQVSSKRLQLHIDRHELRDGVLRIGGWALDAISLTPARALTLRCGAHEFAGTIEPMQRPDVAAQFQRPAAACVPLAACGFVFSVPLAQPLPADSVLRCRDQFGDFADRLLP